ncbi:hypothetical protein ACFLVF_02635 [Chloroflexota bacterium]
MSRIKLQIRTLKIVFAILLAGFLCFPGVNVLAHDVFFDIFPNQGVVFDQVSFTFPESEVLNSDWGRVTVYPDDIQTAIGSSVILGGYINIYTDAGWVVPNLPVEILDGPPLTTYFDLGLESHSPLEMLSARVVYSSHPTIRFGDGERGHFPVGVSEWNAQGAGEGNGSTVGPPPPPVPGDLVGPNEKTVKTVVPNVQAAKNQCFPMAYANSLQYLEEQYNIPVPHDHKLGLKGDNSLVGKLDEAANRTAPKRYDGGKMWFVPMLKGKFEYLDANGLADKLVHKHQGQGWGDPDKNQALPDGDFEHKGIKSKEQGNKVTWQWIRDELKRCEDIELVFAYYNEEGDITGGHAVRVYASGITQGKQWIRYLHDRTQTYLVVTTVYGDDVGLETVQQEVKDLDGDGTLNLGSASREILFAMSESPKRVIHPLVPIDPETPPVDPVCKYWNELFPNYGLEYHLEYFRDNGDGELGPLDFIRLRREPSGPSEWYHVDDVTITITVSRKPELTETMFLDLEDGHELIYSALSSPVFTQWHEVYPAYSNQYEITDWEDGGDGKLSYPDQISLQNSETAEAGEYHVEEVTIDLILSQQDLPVIMVGGELRTESFLIALTPWIMITILIAGSVVFLKRKSIFRQRVDSLLK